jgi:hypothetical protein
VGKIAAAVAWQADISVLQHGRKQVSMRTL